MLSASSNLSPLVSYLNLKDEIERCAVRLAEEAMRARFNGAATSPKAIPEPDSAHCANTGKEPDFTGWAFAVKIVSAPERGL